MNSYMPTYPEFLQAVFAIAGDKAAIPLLPTVQGRASLADGFPIVTSQPIEAGGIPPDRLDFNGILNQLSQYAFWQQSGGHFYWSALLNYGVPSLVFGPDMKIYVALAKSGPAVAGVGAKQPGAVGSEAFWLDYAASITPPPAEKYDLAQYYWFEDDMPRNGLFSCLGGVVTNFAAKYPKAAAYFETPYGQKRLVTQAQYDALHVATWHTLADGTKIGWNGIGGVNKFVWDEQADTLRLPDLAGMTPEQVGYDPLGVGGVHGDGVPELVACVGYYNNSDGVYMKTKPLPFTANLWNGDSHGWSTTNPGVQSAVSTVVDATGIGRTKVRAWLSDARVYLGIPVL